MKRPFTIKEIAVSNKQRNRCLISLIIKEIKIKTTMKYQYFPTLIAKRKDGQYEVVMI